MPTAKRGRRSKRSHQGQANVHKGRALERLMAYIFLSTPGFQVKTNVETFDEELDLIVRNQAIANSMLQEFGRYILVECKNIKTRVNAASVREFSYKVVSHSCKTGIIISKKGYSGQNESSAARDARLAMIKTYQRHGVVIIPLNFQHLHEIVQQRRSLVDVLIQQYEKVRFDMKDF